MIESTSDNRDRRQAHFSWTGFNKRGALTILTAAVVMMVASSAAWVVWSQFPEPSAHAFGFAQAIFASHLVKVAMRATGIVSAIRKVSGWISARSGA